MKNLNAKSKNIIYIAAIIIFMYWISQNVSQGVEFIGNIISVMAPVIGGGAIAFIVYLPMQSYIKLLKKTGLKNKGLIEGLSYVLSLFSIIGLIALLIIIIIPEITHTYDMLSVSVPEAYDKVETWAIEKFPEMKDWITGLEIDWSGIFEKAASFVSGGVAGVFGTTFNVVSVVIGGLYNTLMAVIISIYLLFNRERLGSQISRTFKAFMPAKGYNYLMKVVRLSNNAFSKYIIGKGLDALIIGAMTFAGMMILQFPYAAMISVIVGVTAMIPIIGGYIGIAVGALLILLTSPVQALWFVVFMIILQTFEGNLIYPKLMGTSVGLPAVWIIIAITVGGGMFGFIGMLVAVPVMSVIYDLVEEAVNNRLAAKEATITIMNAGKKSNDNSGASVHSDDSKEVVTDNVKGVDNVQKKSKIRRKK